MVEGRVVAISGTAVGQRLLLENPRIAGFCYTQLTDIEQERNGLYTYERKLKFDAARLKAAFGAPAAIDQ